VSSNSKASTTLHNGFQAATFTSKKLPTDGVGAPSTRRVLPLIAQSVTLKDAMQGNSDLYLNQVFNDSGSVKLGQEDLGGSSVTGEVDIDADVTTKWQIDRKKGAESVTTAYQRGLPTDKTAELALIH
jgi:hypothetical protein